MPPQTTEKNAETEETDTDAETEETDKNRVNTCFHTVFINTETVKTVEITKTFRHVDKKTGEVQEMGEGEVKRRLRVYETRVLETEAKIKDLESKGDTGMIEKQITVLGNREIEKQYWETALKQITDRNSEVIEETDGNSNILRIAA